MKEQLPLSRLFRLAAPALLAFVAVTEMVVAHTTNLTPWKGGGFGMFSTVDDPDARWLRCYAIVNGRPIHVSLPDAVNVDAAVIRSIPSHARLKHFAATLASERWLTEDFDRDPKAAPDPCPHPDHKPSFRAWEPDDREPKPSELAGVRAVRVELWRLRFDRPSRKLVAWRADAVTAEVRQ